VLYCGATLPNPKPSSKHPEAAQDMSYDHRTTRAGRIIDREEAWTMHRISSTVQTSIIPERLAIFDRRLVEARTSSQELVD